MSDLASGITGCSAFWRGFGFKAAAVSAASIFLLGDTVGALELLTQAWLYVDRGHPVRLSVALDIHNGADLSLV
jgi:hypothetical protein